MKIIGGTFKGSNFYMPAGIRPTQDVLRKAIFDILGQDLSGMAFIDIYAGSGAVGLEALSRGAKVVYFVEREPRHAQVIEENIQKFVPPDSATTNTQTLVLTIDAFVAIKRLHENKKKFDIAFLDPPFDAELPKKTLKTLSGHDILHPNCFIIIQHSKREILPEREGRFIIVRQKRYGSSQLTIYQGA